MQIPGPPLSADQSVYHARTKVRKNTNLSRILDE